MRRVQLTDQLVDLLGKLQPLRVEPTMPVFTNLDETAIEPKSFSNHWYACLRALGIRTRGLYQTSQVPGALLRGGDWIDGATAGVFAVDAFLNPTNSSQGFGFRCAR